MASAFFLPRCYSFIISLVIYSIASRFTYGNKMQCAVVYGSIVEIYLRFLPFRDWMVLYEENSESRHWIILMQKILK